MWYDPASYLLSRYIFICYLCALLVQISIQILLLATSELYVTYLNAKITVGILFSINRSSFFYRLLNWYVYNNTSCSCVIVYEYGDNIVSLNWYYVYECMMKYGYL